MDLAEFMRMMPSRAFYLSDIAAASVTGPHCSSCGSASRRTVVAKHFGLGTVYECQQCKLYYRPSSPMASRLSSFYYSYLYRGAGVATDVAAADDDELRAKLMVQEGKDRLSLVEAISTERGLDLARGVCVFGCSWGYEMMCLKPLGVPLFGVELSEPRRRLGRERFGLDIYPSVEAVPHREPALLISSHVVEHIPKVAEALAAVLTTLRPATQVFITPGVESTPQRARTVVGREHPIGITRGFWEQWAAQMGLELDLREGGTVPGTELDELIAILTPRVH